MSELRLMAAPDQIGSVAEVKDAELRPISVKAVTSAETTVEVEPGTYAVFVTGADGNTHVTTADVGAEGGAVDLSRIPSRAIEASEGAATTAKARELRQAAMRFFAFNGGRYELADLDVSPLDDAWEIRPGSRSCFVQIGGPYLPWRLIALPPTDSPVVLQIVEQETGAELDAGIGVQIRTEASEVDALLALMQRGNAAHADVIADEVLAETALLRKVGDPLRAAVGAYYLIRNEAWDRLHDWPHNLADWFPWLPDGSIIEAIHVLRDPKQPSTMYDWASERLLESLDRGLPVYTAGLRWLFDALRGLLELPEKELAVALRQRVASAYERVLPYAASANWSAPLTTFYGADANTPRLTPVMAALPNGLAIHHEEEPVPA